MTLDLFTIFGISEHLQKIFKPLLIKIIDFSTIILYLSDLCTYNYSELLIITNVFDRNLIFDLQKAKKSIHKLTEWK